jgi:hypothetical protein
MSGAIQVAFKNAIANLGSLSIVVVGGTNIIDLVNSGNPVGASNAVLQQAALVTGLAAAEKGAPTAVVWTGIGINIAAASSAFYAYVNDTSPYQAAADEGAAIADLTTVALIALKNPATVGVPGLAALGLLAPEVEAAAATAGLVAAGYDLLGLTENTSPLTPSPDAIAFQQAVTGANANLGSAATAAASSAPNSTATGALTADGTAASAAADAPLATATTVTLTAALQQTDSLIAAFQPTPMNITIDAQTGGVSSQISGTIVPIGTIAPSVSPNGLVYSDTYVPSSQVADGSVGVNISAVGTNEVISSTSIAHESPHFLFDRV